VAGVSESTDTALPFVSVVVPVRNDPRIIGCLDALLAQTYPADRHEIIAVDNGSTDGTREILRRYPVSVLVEDRVTSSYAARNKGILFARGSVIALIDSDCVPGPRWIANGVRALESSGADLVGGHVRFVHSRRPSAAELFDSLNHMQQSRDIAVRKVAKTANLFIRRHVFDQIGLFPAVESGGDVYWTRRASGRGFSIAFAELAEVAHPTRSMAALIRKAYRVGKGRYDRYVLERDVAASPHLPVETASGVTLRDYRPPKLTSLRSAMVRNKLDMSRPKLLAVWAAGWLYRVVMALGSTHRWTEYRLAALRQASRSVGDTFN
jgi:glycosyltransferase involved in cell wall biosynthesis